MKKKLWFIGLVLVAVSILGFFSGCAALNYQDTAIFIGKSYKYEALGRSCPIIHAQKRTWMVPFIVALRTEKAPYTLEILVTSTEPPSSEHKEYFEIKEIHYKTSRIGAVDLLPDGEWTSEPFEEYAGGSKASFHLPGSLDLDAKKDQSVTFSAVVAVHKSGEVKDLIVDDVLKAWTKKGYVPLRDVLAGE